MQKRVYFLLIILIILGLIISGFLIRKNLLTLKEKTGQENEKNNTNNLELPTPYLETNNQNNETTIFTNINNTTKITNNSGSIGSGSSFTTTITNTPITCTPSCIGKECGDNGCGGACGECNETDYCYENLCKKGNVYYLDAVKGDDNNPGTESLPWKTMARGMPNYNGNGTKVKGGDMVFLAGTPIYANITNAQIEPRIDGIKIDDCNQPWISNNDSAISSYIESQTINPTNIVNKIIINANYSSNNLIAYASFQTINLSSFKNPKIHFWIRQENNASTQSSRDKIPPNYLKIALCKDTACRELAAEKKIDLYIYMGWILFSGDLKFVNNLSEVKAIALYTAENWDLNYKVYTWIDDFYVSDGDMHARINYENHGYIFHEGDLAYFSYGLNENSLTRLFNVTYASNDSIIIQSNYGSENQFKEKVSLHLRDKGYGVLRINEINPNNRSIKYIGNGEPIIEGVSLGGSDGKDYGDYYLSFQNIKFESPFPRSFINVLGVNHVSFNNITLNGFNKYQYSSIRTQWSSSNKTKNFTISNSRLYNLVDGFDIQNCDCCFVINNSAINLASSGMQVNGAYNSLFYGNDIATRRTSEKDWWFNSPHGGGVGLRAFNNLTFEKNTLRDGFTRGLGYYSGAQSDLIMSNNLFYSTGGSYMLTPNSGSDILEGNVWMINNTFVCYKDGKEIKNFWDYYYFFNQGWNLKFQENNGSLEKNRIENNLILCPVYFSNYSSTIEKNNFIFHHGFTNEFYKHNESTIGVTEKIYNHVPGYSLEMFDNNFFVDGNLSRENKRIDLDYSPLMSSILCDGSLPGSKKGIAFAGALPCVNESEENTNQGSPDYTSSSLNQMSFFGKILEWFKNLF
ncbi:MAG: hypothetical protein ACP5OG_06235 [Candidatus Nanoarchaeia archaeon]